MVTAEVLEAEVEVQEDSDCEPIEKSLKHAYIKAKYELDSNNLFGINDRHENAGI